MKGEIKKKKVSFQSNKNVNQNVQNKFAASIQCSRYASIYSIEDSSVSRRDCSIPKIAAHWNCKREPRNICTNVHIEICELMKYMRLYVQSPTAHLIDQSANLPTDRV